MCRSRAAVIPLVAAAMHLIMLVKTILSPTDHTSVNMRIAGWIKIKDPQGPERRLTRLLEQLVKALINSYKSLH